MKKALIFLLSLLIIIISACNQACPNTIRIGVSFHPTYEILELIRDDLYDEGINLDIRKFTHFSLTNPALALGELDANFVQHQHFLADFNQQTNNNLAFVAGVYHANLALYSGVFSSVDEITYGSEIIMIDDHINFSRSLFLLEQAGLIKLENTSDNIFNESHITYNPKSLTFRRSDQTMMAFLYEERGCILAIMYPTFARKIDPLNNLMDQLIFTQYLCDFIQTFAIGIATYYANINNHNIQRLIHHLQSAKVYVWLKNYYHWAATAAFSIT